MKNGRGMERSREAEQAGQEVIGQVSWVVSAPACTAHPALWQPCLSGRLHCTPKLRCSAHSQQRTCCMRSKVVPRSSWLRWC